MISCLIKIDLKLDFIKFVLTYTQKRIRQQKMSFAQHFIPSFFLKDDSLRKQLKKINFYTDDFNQKSLQKCMQIFTLKQKSNKQEQMLKSLMKLMEQNTTYTRKLKLLAFLIQISKQTKYDVADILINKKLKLFTKSSNKVKLLPILDKNSIQQYVYIQLLQPMYTYLMKLSLNQQLYNTCATKQIPHDQIFRRGTKIRFIWIFKIYNLIHIIIPIMETLFKFLKTFPSFKFLQEWAVIIYKDMIIMNNFIIQALEEASNDNYILMPYFDMLQFYQSLTEQIQTSKKLINIYKSLSKIIHQIQKPKQLSLNAEQIYDIEVQALRVKLISNSLKNPKKDHTRLQTQYNMKSQMQQKNVQRKLAMQTQAQGQYEQEDINALKQKFKNLDIKQKHISSEEEEQSSQNQQK